MEKTDVAVKSDAILDKQKREEEFAPRLKEFIEENKMAVKISPIRAGVNDKGEFVFEQQSLIVEALD